MKRSYVIYLIVGVVLLVAMWLFKADVAREVTSWGFPKRMFYNMYHLFMAAIAVFSVNHLIEWGYRIRNKMPVGKDNFLLGIRHLAYLSYMAIIILLFLSIFNISLKEAFTSLSIIAAAIAIVLKDYIANMLNGMIITFQNQLSLNDQIKIGDQRGRILNITLANLHLLNDDDDLVYIPNSLCFQQEVTNYTKREVKRSSIDFEIGYDKLHSLEEMEEYLIHVMEEYADKVNQSSFNLRVVEMAQDKLKLKFQYILLNPPNKELEKSIRKFVIRNIVKYISKT